jgi:hypothetical protein
MTVAVKHNRVNFCFLSFDGDIFTNVCSLFGSCAGLLGAYRRAGDKSVTFAVVDNLCTDVLVADSDRKARTLKRSRYFATNAIFEQTLIE